MQIFETHSQRCYLLYKHYLVYNLPLKDLEECLDLLEAGKIYDRYGKYILHTFLKDLKSGGEEVYNHRRYDNIEGPVLTLLINDKFNMTYNTGNKEVVITDGRETLHSKYPAIFPWLGQYLEGLGFKQHAIKKGKKLIYLKEGLYDAWVASKA